tara:strand:+ start:10646 stop:12730 length:2085 start_codon:yes stop_codon:yes gene_type:complete
MQLSKPGPDALGQRPLDVVRDWIVLDFETASFLDLLRVTADVYASHPSTHVYLGMVGVHRSTGASTDVWSWRPGARLPEFIIEFIKNGGRVVCWNNEFERALHRHILLPRYDWPEIAPSQWRDAQANSVAAAFPAKLDLCVLATASGEVLKKDKQGHKLMKEMTLTVPKVEGGWYRPHETPENIARLERYCAVDILTTGSVYYRLPALTPTEHRVWQEDQAINTRGVYLDTERAGKMAQLAVKREKALALRVSELTGGVLTSVKGHPPFRRWLYSKGVIKQDASVAKDVIETLLERDDLDPLVREVCEIRLETGKLTSLAKLKRLPDALSKDGRARGMFGYHRAHTGRWNSFILQLHNLRKDRRPTDVQELCALAIDSVDLDSLDMFWAPLDALSQAMRSLVVAAPGHDMIAADYSAIEARVLPWAANDEKKLQFLRDYDAAMLAWNGDKRTKPKDIYELNAERMNSDDRQLGKVQELGLGYQMGARTFLATAASWGIKLTKKEAGTAHGVWRDNNQPIRQFWIDLEDAFADVIRTKKPQTAGRLHLSAMGGSVVIRLPSGRHLWYHDARLIPGKRKMPYMTRDGEEKVFESDRPAIRFLTATGAGMRPTTTYGGKLTENVTQAIARDCLAHALLTLRDTPYKVMLHVHDSIASEVPKGQGDVREFEQLICQAPAWAKGLPLVAEGYRSHRFKG